MIKASTRHRQNTIPVFKDLLGYLSKTTFNKQDVYTDLNNETLEKLIAGIEQGEWKTDKDASDVLFGESRSKKYNQLKQQLRDKLIHAILVTESPKKRYNPELVTIYSKTNQLYVAYNILQAKNHSTSAAYIGEILIAQCIRHGFTEFVIRVCQGLIEYYSISNLNDKKIKYYSDVLEEFTLIIHWEVKVSIAYSRLMSLFVKELSPGQKAVKVADEFLTAANPFLKKINSHKFHLRYFTILVYKHIAAKNYIAMDQAAQEGLKYLKNLKNRMYRAENTFLKKRVEANLTLGNMGLSQTLLDEILTNSKDINSNWFNSLELQIIILVHQKKYDKAIQEFSKGKKNKYFDTISPITKRRWGLLEAYINFLQLTVATSDTPTMSRYRINKFINETPEFSEDKKGRNIQLIIAQLLFYIIDKNWDRMEDKIEALQKYGTRYLRKNDLFRSQVFIKMLLEIPKRMYHPDAILRHTEKYRKRLDEHPPVIDLNGDTFEIIPYEHLWELILPNIVPPKYARTKKLSDTFK